MRVPVHVLSGFLGAGKTTAVKDLLARRADRERIAVVVNEFGTLGVDGALLSDCASCILREVPGGCVCCTAMADLEASLEEVSDLVAPTRFVLEPTGLARPSELVDLLRGPRWASRFDVRPVITLLDPQQDVAAAYAASALFRDQVETGDVLVLNRCDLASEEEILRVEEWARALAPPKLRIIRAAHGVLPDEIWDLERPEPPQRPTLLAANPSHPHPHGDFLEGYEGKGVGYPPERIFDADRLLAALSRLRDGALTKGRVARAKGLFHTTAGWRLHEIAGGRLTTESTSWRRDSRVDVILKEPGERGFFEWEGALGDALVPASAPLLALEDGEGAARAYDPRGFEALSKFLSKKIFSSFLSPSSDLPAAFRLGDVMAHAGVSREADWMWLVMDSGLFGVGGPRRILENGVVFPADGGFRYVLSDEAARGAEDEVDACRDLENVCGVRLADAPGAPPGGGPVTEKSGLLLYGVNGYTGKLILETALREGLRPCLAGRRAEAVEPIARAHGLKSLCFSLADPETVARLLEPFSALLLAAGPFSKTSAPALEACLRSGTSYLDITGEVDVFESAFARDADAKKAGIAVLPGTGFDVVPSDCLAKALSEALPGATYLTLAFRGFKTSAGTMKTMIESLPKGGLVRQGGALVKVPAAWKTLEVPFPDQTRLAMTIPWGDLSTAFRSTGIPRIEVYMAVPPSAVKSARRLARFAPVLGLPFVQTFLKNRVEKRVKGPTEEERGRERSYLWGRVTKGERSITGTLETLEGYALTAETSIAIAKRVLEGSVPPGVHTPSQAFGSRFIETIAGSRLTIGTAA